MAQNGLKHSTICWPCDRSRSCSSSGQLAVSSSARAPWGITVGRPPAVNHSSTVPDYGPGHGRNANLAVRALRELDNPGDDWDCRVIREVDGGSAPPARPQVPTRELISGRTFTCLLYQRRR